MNTLAIVLIIIIIVVVIFLFVDHRIELPNVSSKISMPIKHNIQINWLLYEDNKPVLEKDNDSTKLKNKIEITRTEDLATLILPNIEYLNKGDYSFNKLKSENKLLPSLTPKIDLEFPVEIYVDGIATVGSFKINKDGTLEYNILKQGKGYSIPATNITYSII